MDFTITLGLGGWFVLIAGALFFGIVAQFIGEPRFEYEWIVDAAGAAIGALVASEFVAAWQTMEPVWNGLALIPALAGGLCIGIVVELVTRFATHGTYAIHPSGA